jgi:hypothetical protein
MTRNLSSGSTFFFKYVVPAICIPVAGFFAIAALQHPEWLIESGTRNPAPPSVAIRIFIALWVIASPFAIWKSSRLMRVRVEEDALLVSNYIKEWRVPFALIESVSQAQRFNPFEITIRLRADVGCGKTVVFALPNRLGIKLGTENPQVKELRRLVGLRVA